MDLIITGQYTILSSKLPTFTVPWIYIYFLASLIKKRVSYQQYINGPHSRNDGQETTEKDTAIRGSNFLNR